MPRERKYRRFTLSAINPLYRQTKQHCFNNHGFYSCRSGLGWHQCVKGGLGTNKEARMISMHYLRNIAAAYANRNDESSKPSNAGASSVSVEAINYICMFQHVIQADK